MKITALVKGNTAKFAHYEDGTMFYNIEFEGSTYRFGIPLFEEYEKELKDGTKEVCTRMTADTKGAKFHHIDNALYLMRWIRKAIDAEEFYKIA